MGKAIAIRAWSRFEFLDSAPTVESHLSETSPSLKASQATNTFSVPPTDQSQRKPKFSTLTFPLKVNPVNEKQVTTKEKERKGKNIHTKEISIEEETGGACIQSQKKPFHRIGNCGSGEVNANVKDKSQKVKAPPMAAVNTKNNVWRVNNSILFNTSCTRNAL